MKLRRHLTRRRFFALTTASVGSIGVYTWRIEPHWLQIVHRTMSIRNLPRELIGASLLHASDLHIGPQVDDAYLSGVFDLMRKMAPEIVVYTGDFVSHNTDLNKHAPRMLSELACGTIGTVGILGNHDYGSGWSNEGSAQQVVSLAELSGVRILRNEVANIGGLKIAGMDDLWANRFDPSIVLPRLTADDPSVALVHNPDSVDEMGWDSYSGWILAGHTHGGQCKPPFLPPPRLPVRNPLYTSGNLSLAGGRRMYINRGIGHLMQVRFNARPEITLFKLRRS